MRYRVSFDEKKIDAIFAPLDGPHAPGGAIGIAIEGTPVYRKGFGWARLEPPVPLSPTVGMRIQSTTKHIASLAYLLLCEEGSAHPDDPVGRYLPELNPSTHSATMRQLMAHTSGLQDAHAIRYAFSGMTREVPTADLLHVYRELDEQLSAPGTSWSYNNGGYGVLSVVIERITGRSLEEVLHQRIFDPVGMHATSLRRFGDDTGPNSATNHTKRVTGEFIRGLPCGASSGNGGVVSTIDDMLRWLAHMDAPVVGYSATWTAIKTPQRLANGTSTGYGLGLRPVRYRGLDLIFHGGNASGSSSVMLKAPDARLDVQIMLNRDDLSSKDYAARILDACVMGLDPAAEPFKGPYALGTFRSKSTGRVVELRTLPGRTAREQIAALDGFDLPVAPDEHGVLVPLDDMNPWKWSVSLSGPRERPDSLRLHYFGDVDDLARLPPAESPDFRSICGRYRSPSTGTDAIVIETDGGAELVTQGRFGSAHYVIRCLADGIWRADWKGKAVYSSAIVTFDAEITGFRFCTPQLRVLFRRAG